MNIEEVQEYCLSLPGVTEDAPYGPDWIVFRIEGKIFLHIWLNAPLPTIAIKLTPERNEDLRDRYNCVSEAYHLNKKHWSDIWIENTFKPEIIQGFIKESYDLVKAGLPKYLLEKYKTED